MTHPTKDQYESSAAIQEADEKASKYLWFGNAAAEKGNHELAERHYERAAKWNMRLNDLIEGA
jgi:hypothetical protein